MAIPNIRDRGSDQLGTLGAGNHFLEVQVVDEVYLPEAAAVMGITGKGQVLVFIHTGSRGLGHQNCQDHLDVMEKAVEKYGINIPPIVYAQRATVQRVDR